MASESPAAGGAGGDGAMPSLLALLRDISPEKCHHLELNLRHPAGAFSVSYSRTIDALRELCVAVGEVARSSGPPADRPSLGPALDRVERFYYCGAEYLDDCRSIIRSLFETDRAFQKSVDVRWFRATIREYRDHVESITNAIKHKQGRMRGIWLTGDGLAIPGYYVETAAVTTEGPKAGEVRPPTTVLAPDANIHDGGETAISLYRDCRNHVVSVHKVAAVLEFVVRGVIGADREPALPEQVMLPDVGELAKCAEVIGAMPFVCFIDELLDDEPCVERPSSDVIELSRKRCGRHSYESLHRWEGSIEWRGDGTTGIFKMPYFGRSFIETVVKDLGQRAKSKGCVLLATPAGRLTVRAAR